MKFTIFGATGGNLSIYFLVKNLFSIASTTSWVRVTIGTCPIAKNSKTVTEPGFLFR